LDEVHDPQNFGALIRTAAFLGCNKIIVSQKNNCPLTPIVSKASSGAMEETEIFATKNMVSLLQKAKADGWLVVGTGMSGKAIPMEETPKDKPIILVLGNEGHGIRTNLLLLCDQLVAIQSRNEKNPSSSASSTSVVDSLNVSVAGGILLNFFLKR
jgi:21S rRNA (GM2251-2'-O)-methyltransferase